MKSRTMLFRLGAVLTLLACVAICAEFHAWVAGLPRTAVLFNNGEVLAYVYAYLMAFVACLFVSIPLFIEWIEQD